MLRETAQVNRGLRRQRDALESARSIARRLRIAGDAMVGVDGSRNRCPYPAINECKAVVVGGTSVPGRESAVTGTSVAAFAAGGRFS